MTQHSPERFAPIVLIERGAFRPAIVLDGTAHIYSRHVFTSQGKAHDKAKEMFRDLMVTVLNFLSDNDYTEKSPLKSHTSYIPVSRK